MKVTPKIMLPILLCWPTTLEADFDSMAQEFRPYRQYPKVVSAFLQITMLVALCYKIKRWMDR